MRGGIIFWAGINYQHSLQQELVNHLGNVLAVISDRKIALPLGGSSLIAHYEPDVLTATDYYPFGMRMPGRQYGNGPVFAGGDYDSTSLVNGYSLPADLQLSARPDRHPEEYVAAASIELLPGFSSSEGDSYQLYIADETYAGSGNQPPPGSADGKAGYRFGFNGHEKANEIAGDGNHSMAKYGEYETRLGTRWNLDPKPIFGVSQYSVFLNSPIWYNDILLDTPTVKEAALMSKLAYGDKLDKDHQAEINRSGWKLSKAAQGLDLNNSESGLKSALFERTIGGKTEYTLAFAGTEDIKKDGVADLKQILGASKQYAQALKNAQSLNTILGGAELTFTGHSLGGGLANASALYTGKASLTFNPAWVSTATMARYGLLVKPQKVLNSYVIYGEILDNIQSATKVNPATSHLLQNVGNRHYLSSIESWIPIYGPISNHMIDNVIEEIEDVNKYNIIKNGQ